MKLGQLSMAKFQEVLKKDEETYINLSRKIPVYITYRTAFFDEFGQIHYRADIYGRDALVYMALADAGVSLYWLFYHEHGLRTIAC